MAWTDSDNEKKQLVDANAVDEECAAIEDLLHALRAAYEQFFLGLERHPPTKQHDALKRRLAKVRNAFVRSTVAQFRLASITQRIQTYERMWSRTIEQMENGTYRRDVFKAKLRQQRVEPAKPKATPDAPAADKNGKAAAADKGGPTGKAAASSDSTSPMANAAKGASAPVPVAARAKPAEESMSPLERALGEKVAAATSKKPSAPPGFEPLPPSVSKAAASSAGKAVSSSPPGKAASPSQPPAAAARASGSSPPPKSALNETKLKEVYDAYVMAKKRCNEDTSRLSYDAVATTLKKQVPEIMKKHNARDVDFKVIIKDGKAILKAVPKE